ncbi:DNA helicase-2/ATP-dependent DNA helicase PcrA [Paenibacillus sp. V4I3]|uniref:HelD family protein n=1 Tax=Paenibacillus sp. V4I3 TaxID=3042305 RepID=UPI002789573C|nr:UvrD-helicase domain-containing protein [Paenibacillus sp. V4I3]MDQ0878983.1 DNA helicase-2/ATP-dependent DNA helicase PcrA [Paenibacillus sp. V4I3]
MQLRGGGINKASTDLVSEEQNNLDKKIIVIKNVIDEIKTEKPVPDYQMEQKKIERIEQYKKAISLPYFGRIDIHEKGLAEILYIGEVGIAKSNMEIVVVDWRADISKVFYSFNGGSGNVDYVANSQNRTVNVRRKRQIQIKNSKVLNVVEVSSGEKSSTPPKNNIMKKLVDKKNPLTTFTMSEDDYSDPLSGILSGKSETHDFKDIIATIQSEQDEIIRLPLDKSIIVQGVAGSGKSSIALHRISYLLYKHREWLRPDQILVLGPNKMFLSYIQSVIPKLDINGVRQNTFMSWALEHLKDLRLRINDPSEKLSKILDGEVPLDETKLISQFKGSMKIKEAIDKLLANFENNVAPKGNFYINKDYFLEQQYIDSYLEGKKHLPINKRLQMLKDHLKEWAREGELKQIEAVRKQFDSIHDNWIALLPTGSKERKDTYQTFEQLKEQKVNKIKTEYKFALDQYVKKIKLLEPLKIYEQLFVKEVLLSMNIGLDEEFVNALIENVTPENEYEDLGALLYIKSKINGWDEKLEYIVVDEAQDHSPLELWLLKSLCKSVLFLGDVTQNIYFYRGINDWSVLFPNVFQYNTTQVINLEKSYRSTYQIMSVANDIITNSKLDLPMIDPLLREGELPKIEKVLHGKDLFENIRNSITIFNNRGYKIISIICKDLTQSKNLFEYLNKSGVESVQLIDDPNKELKEKIIVIPSYLSKGLEFDAVIIPNASKDRYDPNNIIDLKLLFVSVTRAHHELHVYYHGELTPLLSNNNYFGKDNDTLSDIL